METVAYYVAMVSVVAVPAALAVWFVLHPFAPWWRRIRPVATYSTVGVVIAAVMWGIYSVREPILGLHYGVRVPLVAASALLFGASLYMRVQVHRQVPTAVVLGFPEVTGRGPGELVTGGIYSRMRHPRYVGMWLAVAAVALFANYLSLYILAVAYVPLIYLVAVLEERELSARFGAAYRQYCTHVPRFVPRLSARRVRQGGNAT